ncbi:hypothetical protein LTR94_035102, partial [Friedmanniomyces endolithicus]
VGHQLLLGQLVVDQIGSDDIRRMHAPYRDGGDDHDDEGENAEGADELGGGVELCKSHWWSVRRWDNDARSIEMLYDIVMNSHFQNYHGSLQSLLK